MLDQVLETINGRKDASLALLSDFLSIPSVSAQPDHAEDMTQCANWLADQLRYAMLSVQVLPTGGAPIVLAKNKPQAGRPTVLLYGHYDVQPPEPLEKWTSPPFTPTVRDGKLYARGACDDKGQVWCHAEAILAWQANGGLPVNLTALIEGEEEVGSENLEHFVEAHKAELKADICVISDTGQLACGVPTITYGLRGLLYAEVFLTGPSHDLHSGIYGGGVPNPANALCALLASLHNPDGTINLPNFYADVIPLTDAEREAWRALPFDEEAMKRELNLTELAGESGFTTLERRWARPTCDVNGITTGYQGDGAKTVIPSAASAKVSFRLVPDQNPEKIKVEFERAMRDRLPPGVMARFAYHGCSPGVMTPHDSKAAKLAAEAVEIGFGGAPAFIREGGSIPVVGLFKQVLNVDTLLVGFGLPDDRLHSPDEKFDLAQFYAGQRTAAALYERLSKLPHGDRRLPVA